MYCYPGVVISSNSREELDEVIDILLHANSYNGVEPQATAEKEETQPTPKATTPPSTTASKAEKEELNAREKEILDLLKDAVKRFPNPSSVKIVEIHACAIEGTLYYLTLTSDNNFGGSLTDMYELDDDGAYGSSYSEQQLERMKIALGLVTPSCDASKINKALDEYYSGYGTKTGIQPVNCCFRKNQGCRWKSIPLNLDLNGIWEERELIRPILLMRYGTILQSGV